MAIDGKTLRGSRKQGAPAAHLLSALSHRLELTLWQQAVADKTNEIPVLEDMLQELVVAGRVITVDACSRNAPSPNVSWTAAVTM